MFTAARPTPDRIGMQVIIVRTVVVVALVIACSWIFVPNSEHRALAETRVVTVTPSVGLVNQVIEVSWSGFRQTQPNGDYSVVVYQCRANPQSLADCFTADPYPALQEGTRQIGRTGPDGTGRVEFEVRPAANLPLLGCSESTPCSIVAFENDGVAPPTGALPSTAVVAPIQFARSQADCPRVTDFDVRTDGSASAAPLLYGWAAQMCGGSNPLVVDATETSSLAGVENFLAGLVDVGITARAATPDQVAAHPERGEIAYAPIGITALTVVVNMRDPFTGNRLTDIVLSPRLVSRLVTDSDVASFLSDPELRRLNPTVRFPTVGLSPPLLRAERNEDTIQATTWFSGDSAALSFVADKDSFGVRVNSAYREYPYPRETFENVAQSSQFLPRTGQRNVALRVFYGVRPAGVVRESTEEIGFIGIVDLPTARRFGLPTARIINAAGVAVAPTDENIVAGYSAMTRDALGVRLADTRTTVPSAYPLVKVDYAMVSVTAASASKASAIKRLLTYAVGDGQQALPAGYLSLPDELRSETLAVVDRIVPPPAPPTTTQPTATTSPPAPASTARPFDFNAGSTSRPAVVGSSTETSLSPDTGTTLVAEPEASPDDSSDTSSVEDAAPGVDTEMGGGEGELTAEQPVPAMLTLPPLPVDGDPALLPALQAVSGVALIMWLMSRVPAVRARWLARRVRHVARD